MRTRLFNVLVAGLMMLFGGCSQSGSEAPRKSIVVSPYKSLSDAELNSRYLVSLRELRGLKKEMDEANQRQDFTAVRAKAQESVDKARTARVIASHMDDKRTREESLVAIDAIIGELDKIIADLAESPESPGE